MFSWVIYLKTKLIFLKEIIIHEILIQTILHNTFKHFGKNWKNRNWSVVFNIFLITFFKYWNNFCDFKFLRKGCFFKRCLKIFEENDQIITLIDNYTSDRAFLSVLLTISNVVTVKICYGLNMNCVWNVSKMTEKPFWESLKSLVMIGMKGIFPCLACYSQKLVEGRKKVEMRIWNDLF